MVHSTTGSLSAGNNSSFWSDYIVRCYYHVTFCESSKLGNKQLLVIADFFCIRCKYRYAIWDLRFSQCWKFRLWSYELWPIRSIRVHGALKTTACRHALGHISCKRFLQKQTIKVWIIQVQVNLKKGKGCINQLLDILLLLRLHSQMTHMVVYYE